MKLAKRLVGAALSAAVGKGATVSLTNALILAKKYGQYKTANTSTSISAEGYPIPWYTYPAIEYLNNLRLSGLTILEYGSGNSSRYFLSRGANVISIESDREWYERIRTEEFNNLFNYIFTTSEKDYVQREEILSADVIAVDGSHRLLCAEYIIEKVSKGYAAPSMIVFDNSDWYPRATRELDDRLGWIRVDFCGFGPINAYTWVTSMYFNPSSMLARADDKTVSISSIPANPPRQ